MLRKIVTNSGSVLLGAAVVSKSETKTAQSHPNPKKEVDELAHYKCKSSELPLYTPLHALNKKMEHHPIREDSKLRKSIESGIRTVRVELTSVSDAVSSQKQHLGEYITAGKTQMKSAFDYLNEPDNTAPRIGAIAIGGFSGFIFALRGGLIRRVLYTGIGAGTIASICYPKEAGVYAQHGLMEAKRVATIGYNFALGVKPGDDVNTPEFSKFPTSFSELSESMSDLFKSAKESFFASKK